MYVFYRLLDIFLFSAIFFSDGFWLPMSIITIKKQSYGPWCGIFPAHDMGFNNMKRTLKISLLSEKKTNHLTLNCQTSNRLCKPTELLVELTTNSHFTHGLDLTRCFLDIFFLAAGVAGPAGGAVDLQSRSHQSTEDPLTFPSVSKELRGDDW